MLLEFLLVSHIAVLGYWLGSELVINSTYRYVSYSAGMPFEERNRLMDHVMDVDQHVRYALVLQAGLGTILSVRYGYLPGGTGLAWAAAVAMLLWLVLVEVTHRARATGTGRSLATIDRAIRYGVMLSIGILALLSLTGRLSLPGWLAWKLICFAGVIACGLGIRYALMDFYRTWQIIASEGSNDKRERQIRRIYVQATSILGLLWLFITAISVLSVMKP